MKKILTLICTLLCANVLMAQTIYYGDLIYEVTSTNPPEVMVYSHPSTYPLEGNVDIPTTITTQGTTYSVTSIRERAFYGCSGLTSITIPDGVTSIGDRAFRNCSSLISVTCLRSNSPSLGIDVFYGTPNNKILTVPCGYESEYNDWQTTIWASIDCIPTIESRFTIGDLTYKIISETEVYVQACTESVTSVVIPGTITYQGTTYDVTSIGDLAFFECSSLTSVTIPISVTSIGLATFGGCSSLTSVTIPNSVTSIEELAFANCSSLTSITIPNSITHIRSGTFDGCSSLTSVTIPNSVTSIGGGVFYGCSSLTSVTLPNNITELPCFVSLDFFNNNYRYYGFFANCSSLTSVTIPNSVTSIGDSTFSGCSSLTSMTIDMSHIIGDTTFSYWEDQYTYESPFNIPSLQNLTLGENVTSIASGTFKDCIFLQNVTCLATTPPTLEDNTVFPYPNIATLTVPCGKFEVYNSSDWNIFFADRIEEDCEDNTGLEDAEFAELSSYPNPTRGKVSFSQAIEKIEVIDLSGKTLQTYENANEINIEALPAGVYHLRMTIGDKTTTRKVIKD